MNIMTLLCTTFCVRGLSYSHNGNTNTIMGTMEHSITAYGPQQYWSDQQPTPPTYSTNLNLVASSLLSAGAPTRKGVYRLNCPEIPSRRRSADELPVLQSTDNQN